MESTVAKRVRTRFARAGVQGGVQGWSPSLTNTISSTRGVDAGVGVQGWIPGWGPGSQNELELVLPGLESRGESKDVV